MGSKGRILEYLRRRRSATGPEIAGQLGISRQGVNLHLRALLDSARIVRTGVTRGARYMLAAHAPPGSAMARALPTRGLDEGREWDDLAARFNLHKVLRPNVEAIVHYAFTEILNNAIEHSESDRCAICLRLDAGSVSFEVRDPGIGVFQSIVSKLRFADEETALIELLKGRTTTLREAHTGEGLFFTSRIADRFVLRSHRIRVEWSHHRGDVFAAKCRFLRGTTVQFEIQRSARQRLQDVFGEYAPEEYDFQFRKTRVLVKMLQRDYVSRAEARRLLANLEKFREICLDFDGVHSIGQGFADEVFRVFAGRHPDIAIRTENTNAVIDAMIRHAAAG
ncbi:MAG: DUF4325 domain-containing protein [Gammaproteobacteria bacterium]|nr:DUF4325 domain-containing protein [Gammaproteobacteria bacterium]